MLKIIVDKQITIILLGVFTALGIVSKCVVNSALSCMVRAAGNMNKSNHPLMRLVRAKFEHACMVSEKVENVDVFVDKYLYEYRVLGMRLHSMRRLENASALLCIVTGLLGAALTYSVYGMNDAVLRTGAIGAGLGILVYVFHLTTDEGYRLRMTKNYMVDHLQNVCLRRYEKAYQKELSAKEAALSQADDPRFSEGAESIEEEEIEKEEKPQRPRPEKEAPFPQTPPEILPPTMPKPYPAPDIKGKAAEEKPADKEVLIRQILEEFMA